MKQDKISVAMATYNGAKFLREQLDSLYNQTRIPDEIFVSDDHSDDETIDILEEYHQKYDLKYIVNNTTEGVNRNFEKAIKNCSGDYVILSDQDDIWFPEKIEASYNKIKEIEGDSPALVSSQCFHIDAKGNIISKETNIKRDTSSCADTILQPSGVTQGCSLMINKKLLSLLKPFPPTKVCMYDCYIGFIGACIGIKYNMAKPLMFHRHHRNNVTSSIHKGSYVRSVLISKLKTLISPKILPLDRARSLRIIRKEYDSMFRDDTRKVCDDALHYYNTKSLIKRIIIILRMREIDNRSKFELALGAILF